MEPKQKVFALPILHRLGYSPSSATASTMPRPPSPGQAPPELQDALAALDLGDRNTVATHDTPQPRAGGSGRGGGESVSSGWGAVGDDGAGPRDSLRLPTLGSTWQTPSRASGQAEERFARRPRLGPPGRVAGIASASAGANGALD
jgi:hypothetical protein